MSTISPLSIFLIKYRSIIESDKLELLSLYGKLFYTFNGSLEKEISVNPFINRTGESIVQRKSGKTLLLFFEWDTTKSIMYYILLTKSPTYTDFSVTFYYLFGFIAPKDTHSMAEAVPKTNVE